MPKKKVQETEETVVQEDELSAADEHDLAFKEITSVKKTGKEPEEEPEEDEEKEEEEKEKKEEEESEEAKTEKQEAEEAGKQLLEDKKKKKEEPEEEPEKPPVKVPEKKTAEEPDPEWSRDTKKYLNDYEVEGEVIKEVHMLSVKTSKDYTNVLGEFTLDNFKKFETRHTSAEKALSTVIEKLNRTAFWQEIILAGHPDAFTIAKSEKFKKWLKEEGEDINALRDSPDPKNAIKLLRHYKKELAEVEVKEVDDVVKEKKKKMKDILKLPVSPSTGTDTGGSQIADNDTDSWFHKAVKDKKDKKR